MKIGKFIPLEDHKDVKVGYGTVDFKNLIQFSSFNSNKSAIDIRSGHHPYPNRLNILKEI